jgi:hypothetical protein
MECTLSKVQNIPGNLSKNSPGVSTTKKSGSAMIHFFILQRVEEGETLLNLLKIKRFDFSYGSAIVGLLVAIVLEVTLLIRFAFEKDI